MAFAPSQPIATGAAGGGFNTNLLMYMLAGMGGKLGGKGSWQEALGGMTQMYAGAQSQKALEEERILTIKKMLAGDVVEGGKVTMDPKGMTLNVPKPVSAPQPADSGTNLQMMDDSRTSWRNPLPSPLDVSSSDLVGLTPQDVSRALTGAINVETLRQNVITARTKREPLEEAYPISIPGVGRVTLRQWQSLPADQKEYAAYVHVAKHLGDADIMSPRDFEMLEPTEREQFLRAAMKDPKLMTAAKGLAKAGATRITLGEKLAEVKAKAGLKGQLYFKDPKWTGDVEKHISSEDVQNELIQYEPGSTEMLDAKAKLKIKFIEDKIAAGGGEIVSVKWAPDGKTMVWTVKWPSGDTEAVKYAVRS